MSELKIHVGGKDYTLACADGDEPRLTELAAFVHERAAALKGKLGHVAESRLLLMTALLIADELKEKNETSGNTLNSGYSDDDMAFVIEQVSMEIEELAGQLSTD